jgi:hypothetical protein
MQVSMWGLLVALLYSLAFGAFLHLLYDGIRIARVLCGVRYGGRVSSRLQACRLPLLPPDFATRPPKKAGERLRTAFIVATDILFCLVAGLLFSVFVYWQNDGEVRAVLLLGAAAGFALWHQTVGRLILLVSETLAFCLRVVAAYLFLLVRLPLSFLARLLLRAARWGLARSRCLLSFLYERLYLPFYTRREQKRRLADTFSEVLPKV